MNEDENNKKEDAVGSSHVSNNDSTNERVTRKGRRLARQGQAAASSASATRPGAKSSDTNDNDVRATMQNTTFFQHRVVNQPGRPEGSGYWQLTERNARQERLERHRREAAASLLSANENPNMTNGAQNETATDSPNPNPAVVTGELVDSLPDGDKKKRRRRLSCAILLFVFLVLVVALPLALMERSEDDPDQSEDDPDSGNQEPLPVPTGPPVFRSTFAPSVTPGATSFVKFGHDIEGEDRLRRYGYSVAFVGERWVAVGAPYTNTETLQAGLGVVRVFDIYNRSQIGRDLVGNIAFGEELSKRFGEALSGTKDFLAVAAVDFVDLFRYNETGRQWDRVGPILVPITSSTDPRLRLALLQIGELSMDQLSTSANTTLIRLTVTLWAPLDDFIAFALFTIDVSQPTVWSTIGNAIVLEGAIVGTAAGFVGDNALVVGVAGQSVAATRAFLLQRDVWVEQTNFTLPQSVSSTSQLLSTSFFHTTNSTVVAFAYQSNSSGTPPTITVVDVGPDLSVTQKGSPIRYLGNTTPEGNPTNVVVHGDWLVGGWSRLGEFVGVVYRLEDGDWVKQGNDLRVSVGEPFDRGILALSASSLYENVESPTVVAGFVGFGQRRIGFARLFRARGELS